MKILVIVIIVALMGMEECFASKAEKDLFDFLMEDYNPTVRPVENFTDSVMVEFQVAIQQIIDLDEKNQLLTTSMYMTNRWYDIGLKWDPKDFEGVSSIRLPAKMVWKPDILVYNSAVDSFDSLHPTNVIVNYTGKVEWLPPGIFRTTCNVDISYFPFDEQKCTMKFGAWTHQGNMIDLTLEADGVADTSAYFESGEWDFVNMTGVVNRVKYDCCEDPFVDATYTIHVRRKTLFYIFTLIAPCVLVCSLTILIFIFPTDAGERMTLGITVLLAMVVFLQIVADNLPPTGVLPLLGKYFFCSVIMVTLSVVMSVLSSNFHHTNPTNSDGMPYWIELVFLEILPRLLCMAVPKKFTQKSMTDEEKHNKEEFPLVRVGHRLGNWHNELHENKDPQTSLTMQLRHSEKHIAKMCGDLHDIVNKIKEDDEDNEVAEKWKFAARVMDRFCLIFFIVFFLLSTIFTIGFVPSPE